MASITEKARSFEVLIEPANGDRAFEEVTVTATTELLAGAVLGKITATGKYVAYASGASDGSQTVAGVLLIGVPASTEVKRAIIARDATVKKYKLVYTGTEATVLAGLKTLGVIAR